MSSVLSVVRDMKKIIWVLIVGLVVVMGCGQPSPEPGEGTPKTESNKELLKVSAVVKRYITAYETKNQELYCSTVGGLMSRALICTSKEEFEEYASSDLFQMRCEYLSQATISKIIMYEDSAGVILESPVSYSGFNKHELTLYKLKGKWCLMWTTLSDR